MREPFRGVSERWVRSVAFFWALLTVSLAVASCVSRGELVIEQRDPVSTAAPVGCRETMCDYFYSSCSDPCGECWNICERQDDESSVRRCADTCKQICAPASKPAPLSQCQSELTACRSTPRNTICVDALRDDTPEDHPACSLQMNVANCACGADDACLGALDRLNTKCRKCNAAWVMPCLDAVCRKETEASITCMRAMGCSAVNSCDGCQAAVSALSTCFAKAQQDPSDFGGCYSSPRTCTGDPICPYALY
jgi:hypothetical protein